MAGFFDRAQAAPTQSQNGKLNQFLRKLSKLGMDYEHLVIKNSMSVGVTEILASGVYNADPNLRYALASQDISTRKYIAFFDQEYKSKREDLRNFASRNGEIQQALTIVSDTAIVYDTKNRFCYLDTEGLKAVLNDEKEDEIINYLKIIFDKIYTSFYFNDNQQAWWLFKQFLIDGVLAFEIIYDEESRMPIGFKELDAAEIQPAIIDDPMNRNKKKKVWIQYKGDQTNERTLEDNQVIYISHSKSHIGSRISYVENLVRSYNLLRTLENSRILWNVINASFRMKMTVPVSGVAQQKWEQSLGRFAAIYREDIQIDSDSGTVTMYGQPNLQFYKNYIFPVKDGQTADIQAVENGGPDLNGVEQLRYFYIRFWRDTGIPFSRFSPDGNTGTWEAAASNKDYEEIQFANMISRFRSAFQEIIMKPLLISFGAKYPALAEDFQIKNNIGIKFVSDNLFKEMKEKEVLEKNVQTITALAGLQAEGEQYIPTEWLVQKFLGLTSEEISEFKKAKKKAKEESQSTESGGEGGGEGGGGGETAEGGGETNNIGF